MNKNLKNIETILIAFFVTMVIISSSSISVTLNQISESKNHNFDANEDEHFTYKSLTGLAPKTIDEKQVFKTAINNKNELETKCVCSSAQSAVYKMYGYIAYAPGYGGGPCYFYTDCSNFTWIGPTSSGDFLSGGTWMAEERWICCEYGSGVLWEIDPETGDMTSIGGGGQAINGLSWDPVNNQMYGIGLPDDLYKVDYETGETEFVGSGGTGQTMIALVFDADGKCYTWDVKFSGNSYLYDVDIETGACTQIGSMGKTLCYAQDGDVCFADGVLYLTAYIYNPEYGGYLCRVDLGTGELDIICGMEASAEIDASMFQNIYQKPEHDVGIKEITKPETSGYAVPSVDMQCLVKNYGLHAEVTDVQMEVIKCEAGPWILEEYFDGTFPPAGWTTDWWTKSYTNMAGGTSPEARCYKYDQYYGAYDYYDNYIQGPPTNCTGIEKVNLFFRWAADVQYNNYCSVYLKYRKNSTSPWKDLTPWTNPLAGDMEQDFYEIGCYGFGENLGEEFQFKWEYLGYYYYFNYWWLDDVHLEACGGCADYAEIVEDVSIAVDEELLVDFPGYSPPEWQNESYEDTWEEYPIHAFTLLVDNKSKNNEKWKLIDLYYPYLHDVEVTSIDSPIERSIPGQVLPVQATIKNVGQYAECCIPIDIQIGQGVVVGTLLTEDMYYVLPSGWTDEHKGYVSYYGWSLSYTSYSGGTYREARLPYYYALPDYVFYTYAIDTSTYPGLKIFFKSYVNHYSGQGLYALEAGYSHDGENWFASWHEEPGSSGQYAVECDATGGSATTYVGFWMKGDPWYINYWYLDDVEIQAVELVEEFTDSMCHGPDLEPGDSRVFEFDDWTPAALLEEETVTNDYLIKAVIEMEGDKDPGNDVKSGKFTLDFWHDAQIEVASPVLGEPETWLGFDDGTAVNSLGLTAGGTFQYAIRLTPTELAAYGGDVISTVKRKHDWNTPFTMSGKVKIYEQGTSTTPGALITEQAFSCYEADWHEIALDNPVEISGDEDIWVSIEVTHASGQYPAAMDAANNYPGKGDWIYLSSWVEVSIYGFYTDWLIRAGVESGSGPGGIKVYIQPGTQDIEALATNLGTFPELDLTCWAEIYEYITDPENGTLLYEDNITNIDLDDPLGGTQTLVFDDFNFANEGIYGLFLDMPDENDDKPNNNAEAWGIGVDDTDAVSSHALEPATPDGDNSWYVSDVEVTLDAYDPEVLGVSSGVKEIKYKVNNGATQTINDDHGTFVVDTDKDNLPVEYWAIDNVGNEESHHTFTIDMDQTVPQIDLTYEWTNSDNPGSWWMIFTANATDATSKMDRVAFYLNDVLQETVTGPGPEYVWQFLYSGGLHITIKAEGYDKAGNMKFDEIVDPDNINVNLKPVQSNKIIQIFQKTSIIK